MIWNSKFYIIIFGCAFMAAGCAVKTKNSKTLLQENLNSALFASAEGGESRLFQVEYEGIRYCQIETQIFGETGRADQIFKFNQNFSTGSIARYRYDKPFYIDPNAKAIVESKTEGDVTKNPQIRESFEDSKKLFSEKNINECLRNT
jgi:hypothetical protein